MNSIKLIQEMDISVQMYSFFKVKLWWNLKKNRMRIWCLWYHDNKQPTDLLYLNSLENQPAVKIIDVERFPLIAST